MKTLPPLPEPWRTDADGEEHYSPVCMQAYGQQCRAAALEEAATMLETVELRGTEQDIHKIVALFISIAKYIRSLK